MFCKHVSGDVLLPASPGMPVSRRWLPVLCLAAALLPLTSSTLAADSCLSTLGSNFNGTAIAGGDFIWFNAIAKVKGVQPGSTTSVRFDSSTIAFTAGSTPYLLNVPDNTIVFSPTASEATTTFDGTSWTTTVPSTYSGNVFVAGLPFQVPAGGLPGGVRPVRWSGQFTSVTSGLTVQWQWAAAVYTQFSADPAALGVKPIDGARANPYANSDHAGTPEQCKPFVTGGARGGGGSNWTGSYSGTMAVVPCNPALSVEKAFAASPLRNGRSSSFTISVTAGGEPATDLDVSDSLDPALQLDGVTVTAGDGTCSASGQTVSCQFPSLAAGATAQATVQFTAHEPPGSCAGTGCQVVNCATATAGAGESATGCATVTIFVILE